MSDTTSNPIQSLLDSWDIDSVMDSTEPGKELLNISKLHAKYVRILTKHSTLSKKTEQDLIVLRKRKSDYYNGRMGQEELEKWGLKPFKFILKGDVREYIDADQEVLELGRRKMVHDEMVSCCNSILKELQSRTWQLKSYIDWERVIMGS